MTVLEQLARFHAASHHFLQTYEGGLDKFKEDYPIYIHNKWIPSGDNTKFIYAMYADMWESISDITKEYGTDEAMVAKVRAMGTTVFTDRLKSVIPPKQKGFNCLTHGDPWCNNFMFK